MDNTSSDHPDYDNLKNSLAKIAQINAYLNERRREFEDRTKLIIAANDIVGEVDVSFQKVLAQIKSNNFFLF